MTSILSQVGTLIAKDLRIEGRTRQTLGVVLVLGVLIISVLGLGFSSHPQLGGKEPAGSVSATEPAVAATMATEPAIVATTTAEQVVAVAVATEPVTSTAPASRPATKPPTHIAATPSLASLATPAILWVAYLFSGVLCFEKTMAVERQDGALAGLLLAPIDRSAIYFGKLISNLLLMLGVAAVITPVGIIFFEFDLTPAPAGFALVIVLSMLGFAAVGTLFATLVSSTRLQGGLLALVVFPVILPLVIASTQLLASMFAGKSAAGPGLAVIVAFDAIFLVVSWLVFELVLEP